MRQTTVSSAEFATVVCQERNLNQRKRFSFSCHSIIQITSTCGGEKTKSAAEVEVK